MIEKLNEYRTSADGTYAELIGIRDITVKVNEIIDFLNASDLMPKPNATIPIENCTFVTGLCTAEDLTVATESVTTCTTPDVKCPYCGESYYTVLYSNSTCVYYPPIYKDGVNINPDRNTRTTHCQCLNCGKEFTI